MKWTFSGTTTAAARPGTASRSRRSRVDRLGGALLVTGFPYARNPCRPTCRMERLDGRGAGDATPGIGGARPVLRGVRWLDGYWERALHPWDLVGGRPSSRARAVR